MCSEQQHHYGSFQSLLALLLLAQIEVYKFRRDGVFLSRSCLVIVSSLFNSQPLRGSGIPIMKKYVLLGSQRAEYVALSHNVTIA